MEIKDNELRNKINKSTEKISEIMNIVANDPSLALYRIQEHVRRVVHPILNQRLEAIQLQNNLQGNYYDMEYAISANKDIKNSEEIFENIEQLLKSAIFLKQQLKQVEMKQKSEKSFRLNKKDIVGFDIVFTNTADVNRIRNTDDNQKMKGTVKNSKLTENDVGCSATE